MGGNAWAAAGIEFLELLPLLCPENSVKKIDSKRNSRFYKANGLKKGM